MAAVTHKASNIYFLVPLQTTPADPLVEDMQDHIEEAT